jgi:hypothetical protein
MGGIEQAKDIDEHLVHEYFRRVSMGDVEGLLKLFSEDAVIDEPFSTSSVIGKSQIETFLSTVVMANRDMHIELRIDKNLDAKNQIVVMVSFHKTGTLFGKFTFTLDDRRVSKLEGRIKALKIEFL